MSQRIQCKLFFCYYIDIVRRDLMVSEKCNFFKIDQIRDLMITSLGVKKFFNKLQKNFDIPVSQYSPSVGLRLKNRVKLTVK